MRPQLADCSARRVADAGAGDRGCSDGVRHRPGRHDRLGPRGRGDAIRQRVHGEAEFASAGAPQGPHAARSDSRDHHSGGDPAPPVGRERARPFGGRRGAIDHCRPCQTAPTHRSRQPLLRLDRRGGGIPLEQVAETSGVVPSLSRLCPGGAAAIPAPKSSPTMCGCARKIGMLLGGLVERRGGEVEL